jgi:hypothetical protein
MNLHQLSAKLDEIIEFQYKTKYPKEVLESSWRRLKKPRPKIAPPVSKDVAQRLSLARKKARGF